MNTSKKAIDLIYASLCWIIFSSISIACTENTIPYLNQSIKINPSSRALVTGVDLDKVMSRYIDDYEAFERYPMVGPYGVVWQWTVKPDPDDPEPQYFWGKNRNTPYYKRMIDIQIGIFQSHKEAVKRAVKSMESIAAVIPLKNKGGKEPGLVEWERGYTVRDNVFYAIKFCTEPFDLYELNNRFERDLLEGAEGIEKGDLVELPVIDGSQIPDKIIVPFEDNIHLPLRASDPNSRNEYSNPSGNSSDQQNVSGEKSNKDSIVSASPEVILPLIKDDQIAIKNSPSETTLSQSAGITLDIEFRTNQSEEADKPLQPPQLRSLRTDKIFTSEVHDGENSFRFTGLPFENYEFVTKPGELFIPLDSYQLIECRNEKTIFKPETYYHAIRLCRIQLTPVRLILDNDWPSSGLSFYMQPKQINGQMNSALSMGLPEKYKYFHGDFQYAVNKNSISVKMIPGRYKCALIALQRTERSEMEKIGYPPQQLSITVPKQDDWYEMRLKFPATGRIQGEMDTTYFDRYSVIVDPVKDNAKNNDKIKLFTSDKVVKDKFIVPLVPVGVYRIKLTAPNVEAKLTSHSFQVEANKTTIVRFTTNIQDMDYFSCRITDFKGRPIRNMSVQLQQGSHASFGTSDENGYLTIPYRKNLDSKAALMIRSSSGTIMPDDGGRQPVDIQADSGKEIRFEGLTRFRFLVLETEENPCRNYYIKFEREDSRNVHPYIDVLIKDSDGWEEIEVVPKGETKIYGSILKEQPASGLKFHPQHLMTYTIEDISNLQIIMTEPREYKLQFFNQRRQPIQNVSVPPLRKAFLTNTVELPNWIDRMKHIGYRTNHEGRINFMASGSKEESICLYYHDKYGLGYICLPINGPLEHEIYLMEPATLSFDDVDFQLPAMHYLSVQVPSQINPFLFHIHLSEKSLPDLKFQPKRWRMVITSTQEDFEKNFDPSSLEELELPFGGTFTPNDIQKLRKSRFD